jgi:hypothetical protein
MKAPVVLLTLPSQPSEPSVYLLLTILRAYDLSGDMEGDALLEILFEQVFLITGHVVSPVVLGVVNDPATRDRIGPSEPGRPSYEEGRLSKAEQHAIMRAHIASRLYFPGMIILARE